MACDKDAVALLTFSPPQAKAWLYDLVDANPATGIMLCRRHANATVVPMSWQLVDSRDPSWSPPGEPAAPQPAPAAIPGLLADATMLTEPLVDVGEPHVAPQPAPQPIAEPAMATALPAAVPAPLPPAAPVTPPTTVHREYVSQPQPAAHPTYTIEPAAVTPTVTAPSTTAAMSASPMVGTAAVAVVAPPMPDPHVEPPVARIPRRSETISFDPQAAPEAHHVVSLNEQIAAHARPAPPVQQWVEPTVEAGPPAAADLVANIQERLLPDPSLFELPLDTPAVTPHHGYR